jgi:hypothetical protein
MTSPRTTNGTVLPIRWPNPPCRNGERTMPEQAVGVARADAVGVEVARRDVDDLDDPHQATRHGDQQEAGRAVGLARARRAGASGTEGGAAVAAIVLSSVVLAPQAPVKLAGSARGARPTCAGSVRRRAGAR